MLIALWMVTRGRFQLPTFALGVRRSMHLSYRAAWCPAAHLPQAGTCSLLHVQRRSQGREFHRCGDGTPRGETEIISRHPKPMCWADGPSLLATNADQEVP